jgi:hypothetical protein
MRVILTTIGLIQLPSLDWTELQGSLHNIIPRKRSVILISVYFVDSSALKLRADMQSQNKIYMMYSIFQFKN